MNLVRISSLRETHVLGYHAVTLMMAYKVKKRRARGTLDLSLPSANLVLHKVSEFSTGAWSYRACVHRREPSWWKKVSLKMTLSEKRA